MNRTERRRVNRLLKHSGERSCSACNHVKDLSDFSGINDKTINADKYMTMCKICNIERSEMKRRGKKLVELLVEGAQEVLDQPDTIPMVKLSTMRLSSIRRKNATELNDDKHKLPW